MKNKLLVILFLCALRPYAQLTLAGYVKDARTRAPIPYCAIGLKHGGKGWLSNEEGAFTIGPVLENDTLLISFIGYKKQLLSVAGLAKNATVYLQPNENRLAEVIVYSDDDYLYALLEKCRKTLFNLQENRSKVYFVLETDIAQQPVELLECYYNGRFDNNAVKELDFKNGRVGLADFNGGYYLNSNTSKAFTALDLLNGNPHFPVIPLELYGRKLKKAFRLQLKSTGDVANPIYEIAFKPANEPGNYFSGELWIEQKTGALKKITMQVYKTKRHPFEPLHEGSEIIDVSMQIAKTFESLNGKNLLHHIDFNYQVNYHQKKNSVINLKTDTAISTAVKRDTTFEVKSKGLMYFYDYDQLFYIPYFDLDNAYSDYRKISSLTYNESFWNANNGLVYSDKMKKGIRYFKKYGSFLNYANGFNNKADDGKKDLNQAAGFKFYENTYLKWSDKTRLSLKKSGFKNDTASGKNTSTLAQRYELKALIFFDVNPVGDSLQHYSTCIFDVFKTYYNLPQESFTNCFLNIYFDLFEIERRQMEKVMAAKRYNAGQLDSVYKSSTRRLEAQTSDYLRKVERGKNFRELEKWSAYVKENTGIDNMEIYQLQESR